jgi:large subunit ribosomal protein L24e
MVERKVCSFCGGDIEPGTGLMFIKRDGNSFNFCSKKCKVNLLELERSPRTMKWTKNFVKLTAVGEGEAAPVKTAKAKKVKKEETEGAPETGEEPDEGEGKENEENGGSGEKKGSSKDKPGKTVKKPKE